MPRWRTLLIAVLGALGVSESRSAPAEWTPQMFGALPTHLDISISPDGQRLAMLRTDGDAVEVVIRDLKAGTARGTRIERATARDINWSGNQTVLVLVSQTLGRRTTRGLQPLFASRWLAMSADTLKSRVLFGDEEGYYILAAGALLATPASDEPRALFARWTTRRALPAEQPIGTRLSTSGTSAALALFQVDLDDGKSRVLAAGAPATIGWQVTPSGAAAIRVDAETVAKGEEARTRLHLQHQDTDSQPTTHLLASSSAEVSSIEFAGLAADDRQPVVAGEYQGTRGVWRYDLATEAVGERLFWHEQFDIEEVVHDHQIAALRGVRYVDHLPRMHYFDPAEQRMQAQLNAAMPKAAPMLWELSADRKSAVVKVQYSDHPPQWFLYVPGERRLDMIAAGQEALDGKSLPAKEPFDYTNSDGLKIPGYLTVPTDQVDAARPMVVLVHGGPQARDDQAYDYWSAFYAARGYLVYQPNFRGSDGYGTTLRKAGDGEWGRGMQQDVDDGVRQLIADGRALAGQVCIVGASYGGYAALVGATMSGDLYACAVSVNGIANVGDMYDFQNRSGDAYWERQIGQRYDRETLRSISPLHRAGETSAPVLLIASKEDTIVPFGQSKAMEKALRSKGKSVEMVALDGEDHWLSTASTRIEMLRRSIAFIDTHLGQADPASE